MTRFRTMVMVSILAGVACFFLCTGTSSAATIAATAGNDEIITNGSCSLSEAIININSSARASSDCIETGTYGVNDTIQLPAGVITLTADLPQMLPMITVEGQGMGVSIIDGGGSFSALESIIPVGTGGYITIRGLTVRAYRGVGILGHAASFTLDKVEVDGTNATPDSTMNISCGFLTYLPQAYTVSLQNVYVHDVTDLSFFGSVIGLTGVVAEDSTVAVHIQDTTISSITATNTDIAQGIGMLNGNLGNGNSGVADVDISNTTITDVTSQSGNALGIGLTAFNDDAATDVQIQTAVTNSTIVGIHGGGAGSAGIGSATAATTSGAHAGVVQQLSNNLIVDTGAACGALDLSNTLFGITDGIVVSSITSGGGNLSDDTSCAAYFTQPTDQSNVSGLTSTLASLADNGGYVPTIALLRSSPAVDAGVVVADLTADARGATRPQGTAYDSGAYESPYARVAGTDDDANIVVPAAPAGLLAATGIAILPIAGLAVTAVTALGLMRRAGRLSFRV